MREVNGEHACRRVGANVAADDRRAIHARFRMDRQQASASGLDQRRGRPLAGRHLDLGDRAVRRLPDRIHVLPEEQIPHGRVADHDHLVDGRRIDGEVLDRMRDVAGDRAAQQLAGMLGVVADARHDLGSAEALRVLERRVRNLLAGFEIEETEHDRRRAEVHREAMDRGGRPCDLFAVDQDAIAVTRHSGVERRALLCSRQRERLSLDSHLATPHRVAADDAIVCNERRLAREPEG